MLNHLSQICYLGPDPGKHEPAGHPPVRALEHNDDPEPHMLLFQGFHAATQHLMACGPDLSLDTVPLDGGAVSLSNNNAEGNVCFPLLMNVIKEPEDPAIYNSPPGPYGLKDLRSPKSPQLLQASDTSMELTPIARRSG